MKRSISPFSVVLIAVALSVVGIASLRMLSIQHKPSDPGSSIRVSWSMSGASAELIEAEVTSKIEGVLSGCSRLTEDNRTCHIVDRITETVYRLTVGLHIQLL